MRRAMDLGRLVDEQGVSPCNDTREASPTRVTRSSPRVHRSPLPTPRLRHHHRPRAAPGAGPRAGRALRPAAVGPPFPRLAAPRPETAQRPPRPTHRPRRRRPRPDGAVGRLSGHRLARLPPRPALEGGALRGPARPPLAGPVVRRPADRRGLPVAGPRPAAGAFPAVDRKSVV